MDIRAHATVRVQKNKGMLTIPYCDNGDSVVTECGKRLFVKGVGRRGATVVASSIQEAIEMGVDDSTVQVVNGPSGGDLYEWAAIEALLDGETTSVTVQYIYHPPQPAETATTWGQLGRGEGRTPSR